MSSKEIAKRNNLFRRNIPCVRSPNVFLLTRGVASLGQAEIS